LKSRILRIFPGLFFSVFLTVFILGALVTTLPIKQYLTSTSTYHFLENLTLYINVYVLPGVFQHNTYANAVNGSLWTLMYEFNCYILVLALGLIRLLRKEIFVIIFVVSAVLMRFEGLGAEMLMFFSAGMLFYSFRQEIKMKLNITVMSIAIIIFCLIFYRGLCLPVITICLSYVVLYFAYAVKTKINASKYGDLSYGTYIFAFPIQQSVTFYLGGSMHWWENFLISLPITLLMALMSWHLVEKNALKLKRTQFSKIKLLDRAS
jgi:peptidoglycan/LPS O-acetylase OafA/YrhL